MSANVASSIGRDSTAINDDTQNDESDDGNNLDRAEDELDLSIASDSEKIDGDNQDQKDGNPDTDID